MLILNILFAPIGRVGTNTGYSYGFGFVKFVNEENAATKVLNGIIYRNRRIKVLYSVPPKMKSKTQIYIISHIYKRYQDNSLSIC